MCNKTRKEHEDKKQNNQHVDDANTLLEELLSGEIGPDEFEQDGVGNRKG